MPQGTSCNLAGPDTATQGRATAQGKCAAGLVCQELAAHWGKPPKLHGADAALQPAGGQG